MIIILFERMLSSIVLHIVVARQFLVQTTSWMEGAHISHALLLVTVVSLVMAQRWAGDCNIGTGALISSNVVEKANTRVGEYAVVQAGTTFSKDVPPYIIAGGSPIGFNGVNTTVSKTAGLV